MRRPALLVVLACCVAVLAFSFTSADSEPRIEPTPRATVVVSDLPQTALTIDAATEARTAVLVKAYLDSVWQENLARLYAEVQADLDRQAAEAAAARARGASVPRYSAPSSSTGTGDCSSIAAIIGWGIVNRESGGEPFKWNTQGSGAFGCAQTLITHYNPDPDGDGPARGGTCAGDDPNTIDGQRDCVDRLSSGGTNLDPWRLTR